MCSDLADSGLSPSREPAGAWKRTEEILHESVDRVVDCVLLCGAVISELSTLHFKSRKEWRAWLTKHHTSSSGIWFIFYKAHTGQKSVRYEEMVREALCF